MVTFASSLAKSILLLTERAWGHYSSTWVTCIKLCFKENRIKFKKL